MTTTPENATYEDIARKAASIAVMELRREASMELTRSVNFTSAINEVSKDVIALLTEKGMSEPLARSFKDSLVAACKAALVENAERTARKAQEGQEKLEQEIRRQSEKIDRLESRCSSLTQEGQEARDRRNALEALFLPIASFDTRELSSLVAKCDWSTDSPSQRKLLACALMSKLAYLQIPRFEVDQAGRYKLLPSSDYQRLAQLRVTNDVRRRLADADFGESFVVETQYVISVVVRARDAVFVAFRGTKGLYDLYIDSRFMRVAHPRIPQGLIHRGFLEAVEQAAPMIEDAVGKLYAHHCRLVLCGHSLGGALATLFPSVVSVGDMCSSKTRTFTYGMPRLGNMAATAALRGPVHITRPHDPIPKVPLSFQGYATPTATSLTCNSPHPVSQRLTAKIWAALLGYAPWRHHFIEAYLVDLRAAQDGT